MSKHDVELRVTPERKESTCNNTFNIINVLTGFSYIIYNFTIEFSNWDKLSASYEKTEQYTATKGNETFTWNVNRDVETDAQVIRLEEVCRNVELLNLIFATCLTTTAFYSMTTFVCRQYNIVEKAFSCKDTKWAVSMLFLMVATAIQSMVGLFIIMLLSPTSFLTCYTNIARYFCTIALGVLVLFFIYNVILASLNKPILCHKVQYSQLQEVGRNCEVDVVRVNARNAKKQQYSDGQYDDSEEIPLNDVDLDDTV